MRFAFGFLGAVFICFLVWCGAVFGQMGNPTAMSQWVWDVYSKKIAMSEKIDGRKIVIVAGSNALFGVDSGMLEDAFGVRVLNFGVNAGVELPLTLHIARRVINRGDVVLMPLEYPMYSYDGRAGVQMVDYLLSRESLFFWELGWYEKFYLLWHVDVKRVYGGYFFKGGVAVSGGVYGAHHVDENGDQIDTSVEFRDKRMWGDVLRNDKNPEHYGAEFSEDALGWKYLDEFVRWCEKHGARVIFMPSTLMRSESYFSEPKERWFYENIAGEVRKRGWEFVGEPYEYMYERSEYFNTNYHLVDRARGVRSRRMVVDLLRAKCF